MSQQRLTLLRPPTYCMYTPDGACAAATAFTVVMLRPLHLESFLGRETGASSAECETTGSDKRKKTDFNHRSLTPTTTLEPIDLLLRGRQECRQAGKQASRDSALCSKQITLRLAVPLESLQDTHMLSRRMIRVATSADIHTHY
jgi:hypothetical protein